MQEIISDFVVTNTAQRDIELNLAIQFAAECATAGKHRGILITRHDFSRFTVALSPDVPFGVIHERDLVAR
ncbi:hypothetical protein [Arthrobacter sp. Soil762]|uniref:hypothetical protein n=1 Tax=Arthrobacter sp. Soil762 TaxID=1736401 RepID=UPI0006F85088|nr:hypothetical protein [Arthrobacter sp. Soil762]KRE72733.1 hypothetical protein ASG77_08700 [Arthrobacter sp. Soil762]